MFLRAIKYDSTYKFRCDNIACISLSLRVYTRTKENVIARKSMRSRKRKNRMHIGANRCCRRNIAGFHFLVSRLKVFYFMVYYCIFLLCIMISLRAILLYFVFAQGTEAPVAATQAKAHSRFRNGRNWWLIAFALPYMYITLQFLVFTFTYNVRSRKRPGVTKFFSEARSATTTMTTKDQVFFLRQLRISHFDISLLRVFVYRSVTVGKTTCRNFVEI